MPYVKIEQDCRVMGIGFAPDDAPVEVSEEVAAALIKENLGVVVDAPVAGNPDKGGDAN